MARCRRVGEWPIADVAQGASRLALATLSCGVSPGARHLPDRIKAVQPVSSPLPASRLTTAITKGASFWSAIPVR